MQSVGKFLSIRCPIICDAKRQVFGHSIRGAHKVLKEYEKKIFLLIAINLTVIQTVWVLNFINEKHEHSTSRCYTCFFVIIYYLYWHQQFKRFSRLPNDASTPGFIIFFSLVLKKSFSRQSFRFSLWGEMQLHSWTFQDLYVIKL